jgi:replicative DNA helicase
VKKEHLEKLAMTERAVLSFCFDGNLHKAVNEGLTADMFTDLDFGDIFRAMLACEVADKEIDLVSVGSMMSNLSLSGRAIKLSEICETRTTQNCIWMVKALVAADELRKNLVRVRTIYNDGVNAEPLEYFPLMETLLALADGKAVDSKTQSTSGGLVIDTLSKIESDIVQGGVIGIKTGINKIDNAINGGLKRKKLYTIAARPGCGKTALATNIAYNAAMDGHVPLYITIELDHNEIVERLFCQVASINTNAMGNRTFSDDEMDRLAHAARVLSEKKIFVNSTTHGSWERALHLMKYHTRYKGVNVVFIDYIQQFHMSGKKLSAREEITLMTGELKTFAMEQNCAVVMIAQMNREIEKRANKTPVMSDLKESGSIEQDSDVVIMLYFGSDTGPESERLYGKIAKNRQGKLGEVELRYDFSINKFFSE